jgi:hypothetical protein
MAQLLALAVWKAAECQRMFRLPLHACLTPSLPTAAVAAPVVHRVYSTLGMLAMEAGGSCEGCEGGECRHGRSQGSLKEHVIGGGQRPGQAHYGNLLQRPLQCEGKQERPEWAALPCPAL